MQEEDDIKSFRQFAEDRLRNHFYELNTRYQNERLASDQLKLDAYHEHQKIFSDELDEKITDLLSEKDNAWLKGELENIKRDYLNQLDLASE